MGLAQVSRPRCGGGCEISPTLEGSTTVSGNNIADENKQINQKYDTNALHSRATNTATLATAPRYGGILRIARGISLGTKRNEGTRVLASFTFHNLGEKLFIFSEEWLRASLRSRMMAIGYSCIWTVPPPLSHVTAHDSRSAADGTALHSQSLPFFLRPWGWQ
jgi:hypothetical protein